MSSVNFLGLKISFEHARRSYNNGAVVAVVPHYCCPSLKAGEETEEGG